MESLWYRNREEQGLNMEAVYPVYHSRKDWCWTNSFYGAMSHAAFYKDDKFVTPTLM